MKTTQITYGMQRTAERSTAKYAYDKAEVTIVLEEGDTAEQAFDSAKAQCDAALARADRVETDDRLRALMSTDRGRDRLRQFLKTVE
jgi:hypothetical protein